MTANSVDRKIQANVPNDADDPAESKRFIKMAREVGGDEDPAALDRAFEKVVRPTKADRRIRGRSVETGLSKSRGSAPT
jgi:hypothetical protein